MRDKTTLSGDTRLADLLATHPWLREELATVNERFQMLSTPLARVMVAKATLAEMARRSGMDEADLIHRVGELISARQRG